MGSWFLPVTLGSCVSGLEVLSHLSPRWAEQDGLECKGLSKGLPLLTSVVSLWRGENLYGALN